MWIRTEQMRLSPSLPNDFIGKGLKRFLFCTVLVLHGCIFILPFLWYVVSAWLTPPPPKAIEVTLVAEPTADPQSSVRPALSQQRDVGTGHNADPRYA